MSSGMTGDGDNVIRSTMTRDGGNVIRSMTRDGDDVIRSAHARERLRAPVRQGDLRTRENGYERYPMTGIDWGVLVPGAAILAAAMPLNLL